MNQHKYTIGDQVTIKTRYDDLGAATARSAFYKAVIKWVDRPDSTYPYKIVIQYPIRYRGRSFWVPLCEIIGRWS